MLCWFYSEIAAHISPYAEGFPFYGKKSKGRVVFAGVLMVWRTSSYQDGEGLAVPTCAVTVPSTVPLPLTGLLSEGIPKNLVKIPRFTPALCSGSQPLSHCHFVTLSHPHTPRTGPGWGMQHPEVWGTSTDGFGKT